MMRVPPNWETYRLPHPVHGVMGDSCNGFFMNVPFLLAVQCSAGNGWEHVSVSTPDRCPTWDEMEMIKRAFWSSGDTVMQLHVPVHEHVNFAKHCLHLWRPQFFEIPRPPSWMVG